MKEKILPAISFSLDELKQQGKKLSAGETMEVRVDEVVIVVSKDSLWQFECGFGTFGADLITVQRKS